MMSDDPLIRSRRAVLRSAAMVAAAVAVESSGCQVEGASPAATAADVAVPAEGRPHRIMTCNVLLDLPEQAGTTLDWAARRREACATLIRSRRAHILCLQEVGRGQNDDFVHAFPDFRAFGYDDPYVDRRPRRFHAIKNVILFSAERYDLLTGGTYWLSDTPWVAGTRLHGEGLPRHVTWVRLRDRATGRHFRVLNTHWGLKAEMRLQQAPVIAADTRQYASDFPQLLCGDLNSTPTSAEHRTLLDAGWADTAAAVRGEARSVRTTAEVPTTRQSMVTTAATTASSTTATSAPTEGSAAPVTAPAIHRRIDFVFFHGAVKPVAAAERILPANPQHPASDHPFVSADVLI